MKNLLLLLFLVVSLQSFAAGIPLSTNFTVNTALPIDDRMSVVDLTARDALPTLRRWEGMLVYVTAEAKHFTLIGGIADVNWTELSGGGGNLMSWVTATDYLIGNTVIESDKIYKALTAHTSGTFATDLANGDWVEVSQGVTDHTQLTNIGTNTHPQIDTHIASTSNPHAVTKAQIGLGNVVNLDTSTTANISDFLNKRFVTDGNLTTIGNQSGVNTGDLTSKSQLDVSPVTTNELQTPFSQLTTTATGKRMIETGSTNELRNPNFEANPYNDGWTCSAGTMSQAVSPNGYRALGIVSSGSGFRCYQTFTSTADLKGTLARFAARIKTGASNVKMCGLDGGSATANEVGCVTINPTNAGKVFDEPAGFFNYGDAVYGIVIYSNTAAAFPTVISNTSMGAYANTPISTFSNTLGWSSAGAISIGATTTAPTKGTTVTDRVMWSRSGPNLKAEYQLENSSGGSIGSGDYLFSLPVVNGVQLQFNPSVVNFSTGVILSISNPKARVGSGWVTDTTSNLNGLALIAYDATRFRVATSYNGTNSNFISSAAFGMNGTKGYGFSIDAPIAGWEANTNAAIAGCVDAFGCTDTFVANISSTGVVSGENVKWINGNCSISTSNFTCNYVSSALLTQPMTCVASGAVGQGGARLAGVLSSSISGFVSQTFNDAAAFSAYNHQITCTKTGTDFKPKIVVVSPLQGYVKVPGAENQQIDIFKVSYGAAATSNCTTGTCAYIDVFGLSNPGFSVSVSGTTYTLTTPKTYIKLKCDINGSNATAAFVTGIINGSNTNTFTFNTAAGAGSLTNSWGTISCMGTY